jgi:hypothetical protein
VTLEPQVFDLLVYLVRNRGQVVTKDDLGVASAGVPEPGIATSAATGMALGRPAGPPGPRCAYDPPGEVPSPLDRS